MFSHIFVGTDDVAVSKKFYDAVLGAIGVAEGKIDPKGRVFYRTSTGILGISKPIDGNAATHANGGTIGFACDSPEKVKAFHDAGVAHGGKTIEDPPGWREGGVVWPQAVSRIAVSRAQQNEAECSGGRSVSSR